MREISTENVKIGEHIIIDGKEYVACESGNTCIGCAFREENCEFVPCGDFILKEVKKEPKYRPYKDTDEMIADYKERFNVSNVPSFCLPLIWVKEGSICSLITDIMPKNVILYNGMHERMEVLFENYTYLDGSPCGKLEG